MTKLEVKILVILTSFILLAVIAVGQLNAATTARAVVVTEKNFDNTRARTISPT